MATLLNAGIIVASILLTLVVGLEVTREAIRQAVFFRGRILLLLVLQALVPPVIALSIVGMLDLPLHVAAGLLLLAACPVGDIANAYTLLARGPLAVSLAVNAASCLVAPLTMALTFAVYENFLGEDFAFAIPKPSLVLRVFFLAVLPVLVGATWRALHPASASRIRPWIRRTCVGCIVLVVLYVIASQWENIVAESVSSIMVAGGFLAVTLKIGWGAGHAMGMTMPGKTSAAFLIGVRNLGMMAAVAIVMLGRIDYAVFGAIYFLLQVLLALTLVRWTLHRVREPAA